MSGVPSVLKKQKEALLAQQNTPAEVTPETVNSDTPVVVAPEVVLPQPEAINEPVTPTVIEQPSNTVQISHEELQRLKTADGIARKASDEARAAKEENQRLAQQIEMLNETVDKILLSKEESKPVEPAPEPPKPSITFNAEALQEEETEILGEFEPLMRKIARLEIQAVIPMVLQAMQQEIEPFKGKVESTVKTVEEQKAVSFVQNLQTAIHKAGYEYDCVQVDNSKEFAEWIKDKEDLSGNKYKTAYLDAVNKTHNVSVASRIQKEFLDWFTAQLPKETTVVAPPPVSETEQLQIPEDMISPPRNAGSSLPTGQPSFVPVTYEELQDVSNRYRITTNIGKGGGPTKEEYEDMKKRYFLTIQAQKNAVVKR